VHRAKLPYTVTEIYFPGGFAKKGMKLGQKIKKVMLEAESGFIRITSDM